MAKFVARNLSRQELAKLLKEIQKRNAELLRTLQLDSARALLHGCQIIEARAKEILTEKGHVVTGTLRRSINSTVRVEGSVAGRALLQLTGRAHGARIVGEVGTFVYYAPFVEALPDGGYLFPASEEKFQEVTELLAAEGIVPSIRRWSR